MISPGRAEEMADDAYSQGYREGVAATRKAILTLLTEYRENRPWPMGKFGHIIPLDELEDKISNLDP